MRVTPKISLIMKGFSVDAGVIDSDYRDEVIIILRNNKIMRIQVHEK